MKLLVALTICAICLDLTKAKSSPVIRDDTKPKASKTNSISSTPKPDTYQSVQQNHEPVYRQQNFPQLQYQQFKTLPQVVHQYPQQVVLHQPQVHQTQYQPQVQPQTHPVMHVIQKAYYVPQQHNQPAAMIIIAQPVATNVVYGATQQLLNYFHNNSQARYQLLHGAYQQQPVQQVAQTPAHTIGNYQVVAVPAQYQQNVAAVASQVPQTAHLARALPVAAPQVAAQTAPLQLAQIAQLAGQQYARINPIQEQLAHSSQQYNLQDARTQQDVPIRSLPPIITGFENFSPEQQEKIKAQLSAHFGAPLQPLPNRGVPKTQAEDNASNQYSSKYEALQDGFVPSQQIKDDASTSSSNVYKTKYTNSL